MPMVPTDKPIIYFYCLCPMFFLFTHNITQLIYTNIFSPFLLSGTSPQSNRLLVDINQFNNDLL